MSYPVPDHASSRIIHEVRSVLLSRDDVQVSDLEEGQQPLTEQPQWFEPFCVKSVVPAFGRPIGGVQPFAPEVNYLLGLMVTELRNRGITPVVTRPMWFPPSTDRDHRGNPLPPKPFVFFECLGYALAIAVDAPEVCDITSMATLEAWINVDMESS